MKSHYMNVHSLYRQTRIINTFGQCETGRAMPRQSH